MSFGQKCPVVWPFVDVYMNGWQAENGHRATNYVNDKIVSAIVRSLLRLSQELCKWTSLRRELAHKGMRLCWYLNQEEISVVYQTKGVHNGKGNHRK